MTATLLETSDIAITPSCMMNICSVLLEYLGVTTTPPQQTPKQIPPQSPQSLNKCISPLTSKQLYKFNKRASLVLTARGYHGHEHMMQHALLQARRRRYW